MAGKNRAGSSGLLRESGAGGAGSLLALAAGLTLDLTLAILLGAGTETDALFVALRIPLGIAVFFPPTAIQVLVPAITGWFDSADDQNHANKNTSRVLFATLGIGAILALVGVLISPALVRILAPGLNETTHVLAAHLSRIAFLMVPTAAAAQVLRAYRHARRRHGLASALPAILGLTIVGSLLAFPGMVGVELVVWAYLAGSTIQFLVAWRLAFAQGFRIDWKLRANDELKQLGSRSLRPLGASGLQLGLRVVEQMVASFLAPGSISILTYANRLISAVGGTLFFKPVVTAFLVPMSRQQAQGDSSGVRSLLREGLRVLLLVSVGLTAFVAIAGPPFVSGLFALGDLTLEQSRLLGWTVAVYSASLATAALQRILLAVTFARLDTATYLRNTLYGGLANVVALGILYAVWTMPLKILIVPISYALAQIVNTLHARRSAVDKIGSIGRIDGLARPIVAIGLSAAAMAATVSTSLRVLGPGRAEMIVAGLTSALVGLITLTTATRLLVPGGWRILIPNEPAAAK